MLFVSILVLVALFILDANAIILIPTAVYIAVGVFIGIQVLWTLFVVSKVRKAERNFFKSFRNW